MSAITYSGLGTTLNISPNGTSQTVGFTTDVALVAPMDAGDATEGEMYLPDSPNDAGDAFGEGSEMYDQYRLAKINGADDVYCYPTVVESAEENVTSDTEISLTETPLDPNVTSYDVTVTDGGGNEMDVIVDFNDTAPSDGEALLNTRDGIVRFSTSGDYTVSYSYMDTSVIEDAASLNVRGVGVAAEDPATANDLLAVLKNEATDFDFKRGVVGARPNIEVEDIGDYDPSVDDWRMVETAPNRGYIDSNTERRTVGAVLGNLASKPLGASMTYDVINGFDSFEYSYKPSQAANFEQVTAIASSMEIVEGVTTSTVGEFSDIYKCEIIDTVAEGLQYAGKDYSGGPQTEDDRKDFQLEVGRLLNGYTEYNPPLLYSDDGEPFAVKTKLGENDETTILNVGIDPISVVKEVVININVGDVVTFEGATVSSDL